MAVFPDLSRYNPYQALLAQALARHGVSVVSGGALTPAWVWRNRRRVHAVHLHWLELMAFDPKRRGAFVLDVLRSLRLWLALLLLRMVDVRVVWTVHNIRPHELAHPLLFRLLERAAVRAADVLLVHSSYAADAVRRELCPRGEVKVAYHPHYLGWYSRSPGSREELRARFGLPDDAFVFLFFGQVRPYKRVAEALNEFASLDETGFGVLVAGQPRSDGDRAELEALAARDPRVRLELRWISDDEVEGFHRAADAVVLNYPEIFSSGALLLAWSLGRPVVAPAGGTVTELASHGPIETFEPGGLRDALARAAERWRASDGADAESIAAAKRYEWDGMASVLRDAYA